jgi:hypothetical protein
MVMLFWTYHVKRDFFFVVKGEGEGRDMILEELEEG